MEVCGRDSLRCAVPNFDLDLWVEYHECTLDVAKSCVHDLEAYEVGILLFSPCELCAKRLGCMLHTLELELGGA